MNKIFLNGRFINSSEAKVSIFDTGFYYGDGIYEVALISDGRIVDLDIHLKRLDYVLKEVKFNNHPTINEVRTIIENLVLQNPNSKDGMIYIQITRGVMENRYSKLSTISRPTFLAYIVQTKVEFDVRKKPVHCQLIQDPRRFRRDIKMISLMPMNLAKVEAQAEGYDYVIFKDRESGAITEGASSNIFILKKDNLILTHPVGKKILSGCTRKRTIEFLKKEGFEVKEEEFFEKDLLEAKEAFLTGAIKLFVPIFSVNKSKIGDQTHKIATICTNKYAEWIKTFPQII